MAFNDLSQEIVSMVVTHLETITDSGKLASYACVSKSFQNAVESRTFASFSVTSEELETLSEALERQQQRKAFLGFLDLAVILPAYGDAECARFERKPDQDANNKIFTKAIRDTLEIFARCESAANNARPIGFSLSQIYSPMDPRYRGPGKYMEHRNAYELGKRKDLFENRYAHSYLRLLDPSDLPKLQRVKSVNISPSGGRRIAPFVGPALARCLIFPESVTFKFTDGEKKYSKLRTSMRDEFGGRIIACGSSNTKKLYLQFGHSTPYNQNYPNADVRGVDATTDRFSLSLGRYMQSSNLVEVDLTGQMCIDSGIFTLEDQSEIGAELWPELKNFYLEVSPVRPDGGWYLIPDPELGPDAYDDDEEEGVAGDHWDEPETSSEESEYDSDDSFFDTEGQDLPPDTFNHKKEERIAGDEPQIAFRSHPNSEAEELFAAAMRAIARMPKIEYFEMFMKVPGCVRTEYSEKRFGFTFLAKGRELSNLGQEGEDVQKHRLYWQAPRDWEMSEECRSLWSARLRDEGDVRYLSW